MADLAVTVPKNLWLSWVLEGDAAGEVESGEEWGFYLGGGRPPIAPGERLYVVAYGLLRGYAPVTRFERTARGWCIVRRGAAVACTIDEPIPGFRGWRLVWWERAAEHPFPDWMTAGLPEKLTRDQQADLGVIERVYHA